MEIVTYNGSSLLGKKVKDFVSRVLVEFHQPEVTRDDLNNLDIYIQGTNILHILMDDEKVIGTIGVIESKGRIFIKRFYLEKNFRGFGFGRKMFELAIKHIKKHDVKCVYLNCDSAKMKDAYSFYLRNGFEVIKKRNDEYVYMQKNL